MGNRTVVVLYNDQASEWENDPDLGKKIGTGMNYVYMGNKPSFRSDPADLGYGRVVECTHADTQTLAVLEGYRFNKVAQGFYRQSATFEAMKTELLQAWADEMGCRLVKKSKKEAK